MTPAAAREARISQLVDRYSERYPRIIHLIRRGYSAARIAELAYCEVWVAKMLKFSGRW